MFTKHNLEIKRCIWYENKEVCIGL